MRKLSDTLARLSALTQASQRSGFANVPDRLRDLDDFGSNPGALHARVYVPEGLGKTAPLVVVLHGCTQTAAGYDAGSGWSQLADRHGFALLFPEQKRANNANLCFNWFDPGDSRRNSGEALSIRQMIAKIAATHAIDPARIYITGLSAGGAMASVMLATYPEVFAGGAIIAGLPYGCAVNVPQAFDRMRGHGVPAEDALSALVSAASDHAGPWPTISVWHGSSDATVDPINATAIVAQWRALHGVPAAPSRVETVDGYPRRIWFDDAGRAVIEDYSITGMGHGTPLDTIGEDGCGRAGAYMLEAHISSTRHIAHFWGLGHADADAGVRPAAFTANPAPSTAIAPKHIFTQRIDLPPARPAATTGVAKVIEDALRAAGLMR